MNQNLNAFSIISILTLRYDLTANPPLPKLPWTAFSYNQVSNPEENVEKLISNHYISNIKNDSRVGISLSSGIDSTLLLALLRKSHPDIDIDSFSIRFSDSVDETEMASNIAKKFDSHHHVIEIDNYFEELPKAISIIQLPFWDIHWYYLAKYANSFCNTIISGDAGDELFGGYTFRYSSFLDSITPNSPKREKTISYLNCHNRDWIPDQSQLFGKNIVFDWEMIYSKIDEYFDNPLDSLDQVFLADYNGKLLYNWLILNPKINSFFNLRTMSPFLDRDLINFASHIPKEMKYDSGKKIGKLILRNLIRKFELEKFIIQTKQGFSVDTKNQWTKYGKKLCKNFLIDSEITKEKLINKNWILENIEKDLDIRYINKFYGLLALEIWHRLFISKNLSSSEKLVI